MEKAGMEMRMKMQNKWIEAGDHERTDERTDERTNELLSTLRIDSGRAHEIDDDGNGAYQWAANGGKAITAINDRTKPRMRWPKKEEGKGNELISKGFLSNVSFFISFYLFFS